MSTVTDREVEKRLQYLVFELSGQLFCVSVDTVTEVLPMMTLARIPVMPSFVEGFLDWRDSRHPVPILRLDKLFRLSRSAQVPGLHTPLLILKGETNAFGLLVEQVHSLVTVPVEALHTDTEGMSELASFNDCIIGLLPLSQPAGTAAILSVPRLLLVEERERLALFATVAAERRAVLEAEADTGISLTE